ncbi:MAG: ATP-binding protein [Planctomycetota bacterium]
MPFRLAHFELPGRLVALFVACSAATAVSTGVGMVLLHLFVSRGQGEGAPVGQLRGVASHVEGACDTGAAGAVGSQLAACATADNVEYCAVVSAGGEILAHSSSARSGETYQEPAGEYIVREGVARVRFMDRETGKTLIEYRLPLSCEEAGQNMLHVAFREIEPTALFTAGWNSLACLLVGPLAFTALGAAVVYRALGPLSKVASELKQLAAVVSPSQVNLGEVQGRGPVAMGWNRLVGVWNSDEHRSNLKQTVAKAIHDLSARRGHEVLGSLPDGLALVDHKGRINFANPAFQAIVAHGKEERAVEGATLEKCLGTDERSQAALSTLRSGSHAAGRAAEIVQSNNGSDHVLRVSRHALRGEGARVGGGEVWCVRDITQQKLAAKTRDDFLQTVSHELRTPLANMKAYAETLTCGEELDLESQKEFCNTINAEAARLARLVDDLLSVSSMEVGALHLESQETDGSRLFNEILGKVKPVMDRKDIVLKTSFPAKWPKFYLDKEKIATALLNVLGNAAKYTPAGGQVDLRVMVAENRLTVIVQDTGVGISQEDIPRLFDKFFRSDNPRVREETGSGLGLSLVKEVVQMHGGTVDVESELNQGTRFTIQLPIGGRGTNV